MHHPTTAAKGAGKASEKGTKTSVRFKPKLKPKQVQREVVQSAKREVSQEEKTHFVTGGQRGTSPVQHETREVHQPKTPQLMHFPRTEKQRRENERLRNEKQQAQIAKDTIWLKEPISGSAKHRKVKYSPTKGNTNVIDVDAYANKIRTDVGRSPNRKPDLGLETAEAAKQSLETTRSRYAASNAASKKGGYVKLSPRRIGGGNFTVEERGYTRNPPRPCPQHRVYAQKKDEFSYGQSSPDRSSVGDNRDRRTECQIEEPQVLRMSQDKKDFSKDPVTSHKGRISPRSQVRQVNLYENESECFVTDTQGNKHHAFVRDRFPSNTRLLNSSVKLKESPRSNKEGPAVPKNINSPLKTHF